MAMKRGTGLLVVWGAVVLAFVLGSLRDSVSARPWYLDETTDPTVFGGPNFVTLYPAAAFSKLTGKPKCALCHAGDESVDRPRNAYGKAFEANGRDFVANGLEEADSDGDGFTNRQEIDAHTFPGDPNDRPAAGPIATAAHALAEQPDSSPGDNVSLADTLLVGAPSALAQVVSVNEDTTAAITLGGTDAEGQPLSFTLLSSPSHGTLGGGAPSLTYTPGANYNGPDGFTFRVNDGTFNSRAAAVSIDVSPVNDAPVAAADNAFTLPGTLVTIPVLANDTEVDGDALVITSVFGAHGGSLTISGGSVVYKPRLGFMGTDNFSYVVSDGKGGNATGTVTVVVRSLRITITLESPARPAPPSPAAGD
jgi:hypothetical protein